jgi:hypothetical protein
MGRIANAISGCILFLAYHKRYLKEEAAYNMYDPSSMHLVFKHCFEQLFKEDPQQQASFNWFMN